MTIFMQVIKVMRNCSATVRYKFLIDEQNYTARRKQNMQDSCITRLFVFFKPFYHIGPLPFSVYEMNFKKCKIWKCFVVTNIALSNCRTLARSDRDGF